MAAALAVIVAGAECKREKDPETLPTDKLTSLYRGLCLPSDVIE